MNYKNVIFKSYTAAIITVLMTACTADILEPEVPSADDLQPEEEMMYLSLNLTTNAPGSQTRTEQLGTIGEDKYTSAYENYVGDLHLYICNGEEWFWGADIKVDEVLPRNTGTNSIKNQKRIVFQLPKSKFEELLSLEDVRLYALANFGSYEGLDMSQFNKDSKMGGMEEIYKDGFLYNDDTIITSESATELWNNGVISKDTNGRIRGAMTMTGSMSVGKIAVPTVPEDADEDYMQEHNFGLNKSYPLSITSKYDAGDDGSELETKLPMLLDRMAARLDLEVNDEYDGNVDGLKFQYIGTYLHSVGCGSYHWLHACKNGQPQFVIGLYSDAVESVEKNGGLISDSKDNMPVMFYADDIDDQNPFDPKYDEDNWDWWWEEGFADVSAYETPYVFKMQYYQFAKLGQEQKSYETFDRAYLTPRTNNMISGADYYDMTSILFKTKMDASASPMNQKFNGTDAVYSYRGKLIGNASDLKNYSGEYSSDIRYIYNQILSASNLSEDRYDFNRQFDRYFAGYIPDKVLRIVLGNGIGETYLAECNASDVSRLGDDAEYQTNIILADDLRQKLSRSGFFQYRPDEVGDYYCYYYKPIYDSDVKGVPDGVRFAVVRNHLYDVKVNSIKGLGYPGYYIPEGPEGPEYIDNYFQVNFSVAPWTVINNAYDLE